MRLLPFGILCLLMAAPVVAAAAPPYDDTPRLRQPEPIGATLERYYPARARDMEIEGQTLIECGVGPDGRPADCVVLRETPAGMGFGEASLRASKKLHINPGIVAKSRRLTANGEPPLRVRLPLNWTLGGASNLPRPLPIPTGD